MSEGFSELCVIIWALITGIVLTGLHFGINKSNSASKRNDCILLVGYILLIATIAADVSLYAFQAYFVERHGQNPGIPDHLDIQMIMTLISVTWGSIGGNLVAHSLANNRAPGKIRVTGTTFTGD